MFCSKCGNQLHDESAFCHQCGQKVVTQAPPEIPSATPSEENPDIKEFTATAGELTLSGRKKLITEVKIENNQITVISYNNTDLRAAKSIKSFRKEDIYSITYKKVSVPNKLDKARYIVSIFLTLIPPFILGAFLALLTYWSSRVDTMVILLNNGQEVYVHYTVKNETAPLYQYLMGGELILKN